jgi:hypothetical protein
MKYFQQNENGNNRTQEPVKDADESVVKGKFVL